MLGHLAAMLLQATGALALPIPPVITVPSWLRRPTGEDVARVYPKAALRQNLSGRATIQCTVNVAGALEGCSVMEESPAGAGFGEAALALAPKFKLRPMTKDGVPVDGGTVKIPMRFQLPEAPFLPPAPIDPTTGLGLCYGITAAAAQTDPSNAEAMNAYGFYAAQLAFRSVQARIAPDLFEARMSSARSTALSGVKDRSLGTSLQQCISIIPKSTPPKP